MKKMLKKWSTDQSFIRKRNTSYKIGTLTGRILDMILWWSDEKRNISSDLFTFNVAFTTKVKKKKIENVKLCLDFLKD